MPKADVGSHKWLANKMKSKGLQKLKWYCQMCEKQCRDENGFKCHRLSEGHQRQMQVFCQNSGRFLDRFSKTFENEFMKLMRTRYCKTKILANTVYQELISDKEHVHMNATYWVTLSEFVLYLGRSGKCKVESTPKGWYLEYIDVDKIRRQQDEESRKKREITLEQRHQRLIEQLIQEAKERGGYQEPEYTPLVKTSDEKIRIDTNLSTSDTQVNKHSNVFKSFYKASKLSQSDKEIRSDLNSSENGKKRKSALESIIEATRSKRAKQLDPAPSNEEHASCESENPDKGWLCEGILVKIILKSHPSYKKKCKVLKVSYGYVFLQTEILLNRKIGILENPDDLTKFEIEDKYIETVIPPVNSPVKMLRGEHKGAIGILKSTKPAELVASISIKGKHFDNISYDDFSQYIY
ncbi:hypothetical protein BEWA_033670 [Theileria equi strain WA]|uniref:DNA/RNA-binding protein Kin17 WH-like domain-containing protein n=1 Tax=Theileria equi strain WA TaxID=1537102 RepID=L0AY53_THEEQ|nr:hypothetical protein BEWA_033670 [Theileria equi strain WA]AFZ80512.1 hypothetical protein BEWA_033670 [Theileria equi strain WA]|eukprot:XP_004830178.1 hypothetical protein BEWA_033670 [Theileria equi strain WA]